MCGIVGYSGTKPAKDILIFGLRSIEYRGYDSAGVAFHENGQIDVVRQVGKVEALVETLGDDYSECTCGIGHTRWATHGKPSVINAHPHSSCNGEISLVHNGIIENFMELKEELENAGHKFKSETDTEVIAHLVEEYYDGDLLYAVKRACERLIGSYALAVMSKAEPGVIVCTRKNSPLVIGIREDGTYLASDVVAVVDYTRNVVVMQDGDYVKIDGAKTSFYNANLMKISPDVSYVDWDISTAEKEGYPDFMLKEIYEQPRVIRDTLAGRLVDGQLKLDELGLSLEELNLIDNVYIIACGTSYHAGLVAKNLIESWARIPVVVEEASEFRYRNPIVKPTTLVVAVSQSGETADTLAAIRDARIKGARVFGITNVVGSPIARESDGVIYTKANKEIAVASTKSFTGQVVSLTLLAMLLAQANGRMKTNELRVNFNDLVKTAEQVLRVISNHESVNEAAKACKDAHSALFIGRGMGSAISKEGALKLKEISYLHAESYPAGEMKHGPIALIDEGFPVIAIATKSPTYDKLVSNLQECRARGACVIAIATEGDEDIKKHADHVIYVPKTREAFSAIVATVPLQLLAREVAILRGCDVDHPRNLAKSVTVE